MTSGKALFFSVSATNVCKRRVEAKTQGGHSCKSEEEMPVVKHLIHSKTISLVGGGHVKHQLTFYIYIYTAKFRVLPEKKY